MPERRRLVVLGMAGLGDNIYQRPFVKHLAAEYDLWLKTPWPQFYADLSMRFMPHPLRLRTQSKNVGSLPASTWSAPPTNTRERIVGYNLMRHEDTILSGMERVVPLSGPPVLDLPDMGQHPVKARRPIALVRPVTERGEWLNKARNPEPRYIAQGAEILRSRGYHVVSVADLQRGVERAYDPLPPADTVLHKGELNVRQLMALVRDSAIVFGGIGWIVPAALALHTPTVVVCGGHGQYNRPERLVDRRIDSSMLRWIIPSRFCLCGNMLHDCPKTIVGFEGRFNAALDDLKARSVAA